MNVKVKKLREDAVLPSYGTECAAGADIYACMDSAVTLEPGGTALIHTGLSVELPQGTVGLIYARSGLASKRGLAPANKVGVIDSDYRGELMVVLYNQSGLAQTVNSGERIAQLIVTPYITANFIEAELSETARGEGGFGSTGK